jgi:PAS domain S-box-containing protein
MYVRTLNGDRILYADPRIEWLTGYSPQAWLEAGMLERVVHPEDRERVLGELTQARESEAPLSIVYRMIKPDGATVWVRDASEVVEESGERRRRGFMYDITACREAEIARERQARLALGLVDAALDGMCLTDREGNIVLVNTRMGEMARDLSMPEKGTAGERLRALSDRFSDPADVAAIEHIIANPGERISHLFELPDSGRSFQGFVAPVETAEGECLGRVWTLHETTGERTLDRLRHSFTASVSHELRTPLTSILGYLDLLGESLGELDPKQARYLEVITRNANRLLHLVNDLLFAAQIQAGSFEIERTALDPIELARSAVESARPSAAAKRIELRFEAGHGHPILGDPIRLGQALDNLISNALKFTREDGHVSVSAEVAGGHCTILVSDDGIGIPEAEQGRLFERFFRSSNASQNVIPGTGLGLTIVRAIVEAHGGQIQLSSGADGGTVARISIPLTEAPAESREPQSMAKDGPSPALST